MATNQMKVEYKQTYVNNDCTSAMVECTALIANTLWAHTVPDSKPDCTHVLNKDVEYNLYYLLHVKVYMGPAGQEA